jgi:hypothetical protein
LSVDGPHVSETLVLVTLAIPRFVGCDGGAVSPVGGGGVEHGDVEAFSCACCEEFPTASRATTAKP